MAVKTERDTTLNVVICVSYLKLFDKVESGICTNVFKTKMFSILTAPFYFSFKCQLTPTNQSTKFPEISAGQARTFGGSLM